MKEGVGGGGGRGGGFLFFVFLEDVHVLRMPTLTILTTLLALVRHTDAATCVVAASGTNATDDAPAIVDAFEKCGHGGTVVFTANTTYHVNSVMNLTWLQDVDIDIQGTLLVSIESSAIMLLMLTSLVEHRHSILAQQLAGRGLPEPVDRLDPGWRQCPHPRPWHRHSQRQR